MVKLKNKATIYAIILILLLTIVTFLFFYPMKQLPSPVFGGDVYYHYGVVKHIYDGNSPFENSQFSGEGAHYPWLMHLIVAYIAKITGRDVFIIARLFPALMTLLSGIVTWLLAKRLFENYQIALFFTVLFTAGIMMPMLTATAFTALIMMPLFFLTAYYSKSRILTGIVLGLVGLSHIAGFAAAILFLILHSGYKLATKESTFGEQFIRLAIIGFIGTAIAMLYWWQPLFHYHLQTPNRWSSYVAAGEHIGITDVFVKLKNLFFNVSSINLGVLSITSLLGLVLCLFNIKKEKAVILPLLIFLTGLIGFAHPILTLPLFNTSIGSYGFDVVFLLATPIFCMMFFYLLLPKIPENAEEPALKKLKIRSYAVILLAALLTALILNNTYSTFDKDQWTRVGRQESVLIDELQNATKVLDASPDGVILPFDEEDGFAINAISGKKVVFARRTHTSPFVDANKRAADAAVMLFGNNSETRFKLFKQYGVKYFYTDQNGIQDTYNCYNYWDQIQGDASFSCLVTSVDYENYLTENGITWKTTISRLDPASAVAPVFTIVVIKPNPVNLSLENIFVGKALQVAKVLP